MDDNIISKTIKGCLNFVFTLVSLWFKVWLLPVNSVFEWALEKVKPVLDPLFSFFEKNKSKLLKYSILSIFYLSFLLFFTILTYYAIYTTLVPKVSTEEPLFFDYGFKSTKKIVADVQAAVEFQKSQHYSIYLELELPESPKNQEIGMFMACMDIDDHDKWNPQKIHHTCRPAMLKYTSSALKSMKSFFLAIPYLFGIYEEKQTIILQMGENFIANRFYQSISASIQINNPDIQIYKASLKFLANLNGFDYYLYYYPITSFIIGCSLIYLTLASSTLFVIISLYLYRHFNKEELELESESEIGSDTEDANEEELLPENDEDYDGILVGDDEHIQKVKKQQIQSAPPTIQRRNGATSTISTQKRKPIWDIEDGIGGIGGHDESEPSSSSTTFDNKQQHGDDETLKYSWDKDDHHHDNEIDRQHKSKSSPLLRSINNNNYNPNNNETTRLPPLIIKENKSFKYSDNEGGDSSSSDESSKTPSGDDASPRFLKSTLIISATDLPPQLSTSTRTFVQENNNHEQLQLEQTIPSTIINLADNSQQQQQQQADLSKSHEQQEPSSSIETSDNNNQEEKEKEKVGEEEELSSTIVNPSESGTTSSSEEDREEEEEEVVQEETGNSGYANDEWVKITDSSVRKRKN